MEEIWKDIKGFETIYQVSTFGRVKSLARKWNTANGGVREKSDTIISAAINHKGYFGWGLSLNGKRKYYFIHRLVALHFIPNPDDKPQINHKNGIKTDNRVENLEWCTQSENLIHSIEIGIRKPVTGIKNKRSIPIIAINIKTGIQKTYAGLNDAARILSLSAGNICEVLKGNRKNIGGYLFHYK